MKNHFFSLHRCQYIISFFLTAVSISYLDPCQIRVSRNKLLTFFFATSDETLGPKRDGKGDVFGHYADTERTPHMRIELINHKKKRIELISTAILVSEHDGVG